MPSPRRPAARTGSNSSPHRPWTFHRAIDQAPDLGDAVRQALTLPGCDQVLTAGSSSGVDAGMARLTQLLRTPALAPRVLVGGGVTIRNLPQVLGAGGHGIHLGRVVRADGTWDSPVRAELVRAAVDLIHPAARS